MATFWVKTTVEYEFEIEADSEEQAEREGWNYDDYPFAASVYSIEVEEQEDYDDEE